MRFLADRGLHVDLSTSDECGSQLSEQRAVDQKRVQRTQVPCPVKKAKILYPIHCGSARPIKDLRSNEIKTKHTEFLSTDFVHSQHHTDSTWVSMDFEAKESTFNLYRRQSSEKHLECAKKRDLPDA